MLGNSSHPGQRDALSPRLGDESRPKTVTAEVAIPSGEPGTPPDNKAPGGWRQRKQSSATAAHTASTALNDGRGSKSTKSLAGSVLT